MSSYEVYAVKYAEREAVRAEHFIGGDIHDNSPMPMDYFVWVIRDNPVSYTHLTLPTKA